MENSELESLSDLELLKRKRFTTIVLGVVVGIVIVAIIMFAHSQMIRTEHSNKSLVGLVSLVTVFPVLR